MVKNSNLVRTREEIIEHMDEIFSEYGYKGLKDWILNDPSMKNVYPHVEEKNWKPWCIGRMKSMEEFIKYYGVPKECEDCPFKETCSTFVKMDSRHEIHL